MGRALDKNGASPSGRSSRTGGNQEEEETGGNTRRRTSKVDDELQTWVFPPASERSYPLSWLDRAPHLANAITAAQTSREFARLIEALAGETSVSRRVYDELMRTPGQFPDIESIAARLRLTDRTLRRHLRREGHSFRQAFARWTGVSVLMTLFVRSSTFADARSCA